jgi:two-component system sensor histidine kinase KdpD
MCRHQDGIKTPCDPPRWDSREPVILRSRIVGDLAAALGLVALATIAGRLGGSLLSDADFVMTYLLAVLVLAFWRGRRAALIASALSVGTYNFFFVPPFHTFAVADTRNLLTFSVLFIVGVAAGTLAERLRRQEAEALAREQRTAMLLSLTRAVANATGEAEVARAIVTEASTSIARGAALLCPGPEGMRPVAVAGEITLTAATLTRADDPALDHLPITMGDERFGTLVLCDPRPGLRDLGEAYARQAALALARARQVAVAEEATLRARTEELRSALLSTVSHDLRTPLAAITGAATALLDPRVVVGPRARDELLEAVRHEAARMERLVANLLEMTRLASGPLIPRPEWVPVEELVGSAWSRVEASLAGHPVSTELGADLPLVAVDPLLFEHVLVNLLENAARHTSPGTPIHLRAGRVSDGVEIEVRDEGAGWPQADLARLFDPFVRGAPAHVTGSGLGLAICRGIVEAHGGSVRAVRPAGGGASVVVLLPSREEPPEMPTEEAS